MANKTNAERETIIRRAADEKDWEVYSEDPRIIRKLEKLYGCGRTDHQSDGRVWILPPNGLSLRKPRALGAEQKEKLRARLAKNREKSGGAS